MFFSTKGRYGLRAMADMAFHAAGGPVTVKSIAERQGISEAYLEQVFSQLRRAGLITSIRGAQGGYEMARKPEEITVGEILTALEGPIAPVACVSEEGKQKPCSRENDCLTRPFWEELRAHVDEIVNKTTLADLLTKKGRTEGNFS